MDILNTGIEGIVAELSVLDEVLTKHDLIRAGQWDYERVTYDKKYVIKEGTYYLRVFGYTPDEDIGTREAVIHLKTPAVGKHYYPHGVEYGEDEVYPEGLIKDCQATLKAVYEELQNFNLAK
ncbi:hypothetical protein NCCP2222_16530 [Sporosarcina sp. NCCP-2222]|uniref:YugN family protein n=1 Tax=Sporosarcina sp. NCCP-2222 TaxID=2935073 RepID=UPI0020821ED3|nr:YugN family protein [Sporosarcina sp. NCCP-2222]GKV55706.1 hypothetical protein NCCP2222_16530 [Sporosarcina sp. NCCP-2222]